MTNSNSNISEVTFESICDSDFLELKGNNDLAVGLCIAKKEYIPIEDFQTIFKRSLEEIKKNQWKYFIFDKSNLSTFHQPSMEWYYTVWKKSLIDEGLNQHYKILPQMAWFKTSVDAGIAEIKRNFPDIDFDSFTVTYVDSVAEAIEKIQRTI